MQVVTRFEHSVGTGRLCVVPAHMYSHTCTTTTGLLAP